MSLSVPEPNKQQKSLTVYFTNSPQTIRSYSTQSLLREHLEHCAAERGFNFAEEFESTNASKTLVAAIGEINDLWLPDEHDVCDFSYFRTQGMDLSQATIFWTLTCGVCVGKISFAKQYKSTQSFEEFERALLSVDIVQRVLRPVIDVKVGSSTKPFTEAVLHEYIRNNEHLDLVIRSQHARYSDLRAEDILPLFAFSPPVDSSHMPSRHGNCNDELLSALFAELTSSPEKEFSDKVDQWADILLEVNKRKPFGLSLGFDYLRFIQPGFPPQSGQNKDWNEAQRRAICDPIMYTVAAILSQRVFEEIEVWPEYIFPGKEALGHGPLDYFLCSGSSAVVVRKSRRVKRSYNQIADNEDAHKKVDSRDKQNCDDIGKQSPSSVEKALTQVLAQTVDTMRTSSLPDIYPKGQTNSVCRRFCVLSTGSRYFFFRIDWSRTCNEEKPVVTYLGVFNLHYFPVQSNGAPTDGHAARVDKDEEEFNMKEYATVIAAFLVCTLDSGEEDGLRSLLDKAALKFEAS